MPTRPRNAACHCGTVRFTVALPVGPLTAMRCTCSLCAMKGAVMVGAPSAALNLIAGEDKLACYRFHSGEARHYFCPTCGIHCFHQRRADPQQYAVNAACLEGVSPYDFRELPVVDGIHHPGDGGPLRRAGTLRFEPAEDQAEKAGP